jgi:endonuclease-3
MFEGQSSNERAIRVKLVEHGKLLFDRPKQPIQFTKKPEANFLLNDLETHPHAFVLACIMDRQIKAEQAWLIPHRMSKKLDGSFSMEKLAGLPQEAVKDLMSRPDPLHRFVDTMSNHFYAGVQRIANHYDGDAARMWAGNPSSAEVVYRFLEFEGIGPKIATMATNILARSFKIPFSDHVSVDISADVHVCRVFERLGLCSPNPSPIQVTYKARALHPIFPGIIDEPIWEIGRTWCEERNPKCSACYMNDLCPTSLRRRTTQ